MNSIKHADIMRNFYEPLSSLYHFMFVDWEATMRSHGAIISRLIPNPDQIGPVLDCTCGIGTQSIALAALGYQVEGRDLSPSMIERAIHEAKLRHLAISFQQDDVRVLKTAPLNYYGAVISMDNALPHLKSDEEIIVALGAMRQRLKSGGQLLLSLRDYEKLIQAKVNVDPPKFCHDGPYRRIMHQVWDWQSEKYYVLHQYITCETSDGWRSHHFTGEYRTITVNEMIALVKQVGFSNVRVLSPETTGFHQPIIQATRK